MAKKKRAAPVKRRKPARGKPARGKKFAFGALIFALVILTVSGVAYYRAPIAESIGAVMPSKEPDRAPVVAIGRVVRVIDASLVEIEVAGKNETVRLRHIEPTPEKSRQATEWVRARLDGRQVRVVGDGTKIFDVRGNRLVYLLVDGENLNLEIVKAKFSPYGQSHGASTLYDAEFRRAQ